MITVCGLNELDTHCARGVTHILSILDPGYPEPEAFRAHPPRRRAMLRFHDKIEPGLGLYLPQSEHVRGVLAFGTSLLEDAHENGNNTHALVHCHMGVSRSTAAMAILLAQIHPQDNEDAIFAQVLQIRPQAWPNCVMIEFADDLLARSGRLTAALGRLYATQLAARPELEAYMQENGRGLEVGMARA